MATKKTPSQRKPVSTAKAEAKTEYVLYAHYGREKRVVCSGSFEQCEAMKNIETQRGLNEGKGLASFTCIERVIGSDGVVTESEVS